MFVDLLLPQSRFSFVPFYGSEKLKLQSASLLFIASSSRTSSICCHFRDSLRPEYGINSWKLLDRGAAEVLPELEQGLGVFDFVSGVLQLLLSMVMSLESEVPTHVYVEDNETMKQADDKTVSDNHVGSSNIKDNGTVLTNNDTLDAQLDVNSSSPPLGNHRTTTEGAQAVNPLQPEDKSLPRQSPQSTKGYGLKKWRRVRRDFFKGIVLNPESSSSVSTSKAVHLSSGGIKRNDGVVPFNIMRNMGVIGASTVQDSSSDSRIGNGVTAAAVDFEKSDDRSSESSTAASAPRVKYDFLAGLEQVWDKNWLQNLAGTSRDSAQKSKGSQLESGKRHRGERVKVMEENSHSSMESDSRSSNFFFVQGEFSYPENRDQIRTSMKYVGDNNNKACSSEQHDHEIRTVEEKEVADEGQVNNRPTSQDPFVESILALQSVEKALETELHKLREMGKEAATLHVDANLASSSPVGPTSEVGIHEPSSLDQLDPESIVRNSSSYLETQVSTLTENVNYLESKLKETTALLVEKELRITELAATLTSSSNQLEGQPPVTPSQQDRLLDMETELEDLFRQKIEAEVEYLALVRPVTKLREVHQEENELFRQQNSLVGEQSAALNKLREIGNKAQVIAKQAVDLETRAGDVLDMEETLKLQKRVCSVSIYFLIQMVSLILVFWFVASQLSADPLMDVEVPT